jgi:glyoxylate reductase
MQKPKIYVTRMIPEEGLALLRQTTDMGVWPHKRRMTREEQLQAVRECRGLLATHDVRIDGDFLRECPPLRVVSNFGVGYDNIDVAACTARGVLAGNTPDVLSETTADLAFALIMATARRLVEMAEFVKTDRWQPDIGILDNLGVDIHHATLGIIGLGRIGSQVAKRGVGFNMRVVYHDIHRKQDAEAALGVEPLSKEDLLSQSDFVSLHVPLTAETANFFGPAEFNRMKPTAILINTARGKIVDRNALLTAIETGRIAGAGLDVTDPEPMRADDPLLRFPQVTVLPHIGSATRRTRARMAEVAAHNLINALTGRPMISCLNPEAAGRS